LQELGYSGIHSFVTPPPPGAEATVRFLAVADLGHAQLDGSQEVNANHVRENTSYNNQSMQQVHSLTCALLKHASRRSALCTFGGAG